MSGVGGIVLLLFLLTPSLAIARSTNASLAGRVTDAYGGVIVDASVTALSKETNVPPRRPDNGTGEYSLMNLPPARYRIAVEKTGFRK